MFYGSCFHRVYAFVSRDWLCVCMLDDNIFSFSDANFCCMRELCLHVDINFLFRCVKLFNALVSFLWNRLCRCIVHAKTFACCRFEVNFDIDVAILNLRFLWFAVSTLQIFAKFIALIIKFSTYQFSFCILKV